MTVIVLITNLMELKTRKKTTVELFIYHQ